MKKITTLIKARLDYAAVVWLPHRKKDTRKLEKIQRIGTMMVPEVKSHQTCHTRLDWRKLAYKHSKKEEKKEN